MSQAAGSSRGGSGAPVASSPPLTLRLNLDRTGPVRCGEPVPLRISVTNNSAAPLAMVGVVDGSESALRFPHYLPAISQHDKVVARPPSPEDPLVGPLRTLDIVRLAPRASFDPCAGFSGAAYLPLSTFANFRAAAPGLYRFTLTLNTTSPRPEAWLGRFNQDLELDAVLALIGQVPKVELTSVIDVSII